MGGMSLWHMVILTVFSLVWLVPAWRIVGKAGFPPLLSLLALIPLVNVVMLWVFAFTRWPSERRGA